MAPAHDPHAVDDYLAALPPPRRAALQRVREHALGAAPGATERVSYGIPIIRLHRDLIGLSAAAAHLSLHVMSPDLAAATRERHPELAGSGATIHFTEDDPLPRSVVEEIVTGRIAELGAS